MGYNNCHNNNRCAKSDTVAENSKTEHTNTNPKSCGYNYYIITDYSRRDGNPNYFEYNRISDSTEINLVSNRKSGNSGNNGDTNRSIGCSK